MVTKVPGLCSSRGAEFIVPLGLCTCGTSQPGAALTVKQPRHSPVMKATVAMEAMEAMAGVTNPCPEWIPTKQGHQRWAWATVNGWLNELPCSQNILDSAIASQLEG